MQISEVIRKYRKSRNMTQEEVANCLGVTTPAVNKWENGNSFPDIMMLAPIGRLFGITLDTLLSFQEELTDDEIYGIIEEVNSRLKNDTYDKAFQWAKRKLELYPNCERLILWTVQVLDAQRCMMQIPDSADYDDYISDCYTRVLSSQKEEIRREAAESLFGFYLRKEQYEKAEKYLVYISEQNPERKRKQATIYSKTNRIEEAYKLYEELLFTGYQTISMVFHSIYMLALQEKDMQKAHVLVDKQEQLAKLFEMGEYQEISTRLELAVEEKDIDMTIDTMERMLASVGKISAFCKSSLYEHMAFKNPQEEYLAEIKRNLLESFQDEETFGFLKSDKRWKELIDKANQKVG